jgi:tRNA threonylcarbamoyladenosine biosynthesis protein TsaE
MKVVFSERVALNQISLLVRQILQRFPHGAVIGLTGELGSGKTTLVRALIQHLAQRQNIKIDRVMSPSFVLHQSYDRLVPPVHHFDLYRMQQVTEEALVELEYFEIIEKMKPKQGFVFVEWPELCVDKRILHLSAEITLGLRDQARQYAILIP